MQVNGKELDLENIRKKYKDKKTKVQVAVLLTIVVGYLFFFSSNWIFGLDSQTYYTPIGEKQTLTKDRTVSVTTWKYSSKQALMEVQIAIDNTSLDGIDSYTYSSSANYQDSRKGSIKLPVTVKLEDVDYAVLWIKNIPEDYNSCSLDVFMPDEKDYVQLFSNRKKVEIVTKITSQSYDEYKIQEIKQNIELRQKRIKANKKTIDKLNAEILLINKKIEKERSRQKYMTASEIIKSEDVIEDYNKEIVDRQNQITDKQNKNIRHRNRITEYEELIEKIKNSSS